MTLYQKRGSTGTQTTSTEDKPRIYISQQKYPPSKKLQGYLNLSSPKIKVIRISSGISPLGLFFLSISRVLGT